MIQFKVREAGKTNKTESTSGWFQEWQSAVASVRVVFDVVHFMFEFSNVVRGLGF